ncbi:MAG TPA: membrane protein insertase YidC, partial [Thermodesulfobacteriota bacterium]|nr:membrane protein insertase YidC [Thermodesulfobacteriota bacterium]
MDKRVLIAVILSMAVLFFYPYLLQKFSPAQQKTRSIVNGKEGAPSAPVNGSLATAPAGGAAAAAPAAPVTEELTTVDTPLFKAGFTSQGGGVKSFELKRYRTALKADSPVVNVADTVARSGSFKTHITSNGVSEFVPFTPSARSITLNGKDTAELTYSGTTKTGLRVEKKYLFTAGSYI